MDWVELAQEEECVAGSCDHGNELSVSIKCLEILE
jgi:hypothetical protein